MLQISAPRLPSAKACIELKIIHSRLHGIGHTLQKIMVAIKSDGTENETEFYFGMDIKPACQAVTRNSH